MKTKASRTSPQSLLWMTWMVCLGIILLLGPELFPVQAQGGAGSGQNPLLLEKPTGKLSYRLELLTRPSIAGQDAETQAKMLSLPVSGPGSLLKNEQGALLVYIRLNNISAANLEALTDAGAQITHAADEYRTVTAYVGTGQLNTVAAVEAVESVREALAPMTSGAFLDWQDGMGTTSAHPHGQADCLPATTSEGDAQLNADDARTTFGIDGSGVTVGVLSDSYDNHGGVPAPPATTAVVDIASGDLPGVGNPCGRPTPVNVIKEGSPSSGKIDEGRAMLQIVHDLAPEADLAFATAFGGLLDFADQIRALRNSAGADVIVDDVAYLDEPFFQDGPVSVAIKDVTADGALYFTSAGNSHAEDGSGNAIASYEAAAYRPTACPPGLPAFAGNSCHDFDPTGGTDNRYSFTVANNDGFRLAFQWADPWFGIQTDFDIYLLDSSNTIQAGSVNDNIVTQEPFEAVDYVNNTGSTQTVDLVINRFSGVAPRIKHILIQSPGVTAVEYNASNSTDIFGPTVFGHAGEDTALSIAAVPYDDADSPEDFTSRGFPTYYFGPTEGVPQPAAALPSPDTRLKPDVAATDGGCNTFFGTFDFIDNCYRFFGTSAAAPHAAAVGALMKEQADARPILLTQGFARGILKNSAATIAFGSLEATGAGLINATQAITGVNNLEITSVYLPTVLKN